MTKYLLKCIALPAANSGLILRATVGKVYEATHDTIPGRVVIVEDNGQRHTFGLPGTDQDKINKWRTSDYFEVVDDTRPKDVSGKVLELGDKVAFCSAGRSSDMRIGEVVRITPKQVEIAHPKEPQWNGKGYFIPDGHAFTKRNHENVAKV